MGPSKPLSDAGTPGADDATAMRMRAAVRVVLEQLGEDPSREGIVDTPKVRLRGR